MEDGRANNFGDIKNIMADLLNEVEAIESDTEYDREFSQKSITRNSLILYQLSDQLSPVTSITSKQAYDNQRTSGMSNLDNPDLETSIISIAGTSADAPQIISTTNETPLLCASTHAVQFTSPLCVEGRSKCENFNDVNSNPTTNDNATNTSTSSVSHRKGKKPKRSILKKR